MRVYVLHAYTHTHTHAHAAIRVCITIEFQYFCPLQKREARKYAKIPVQFVDVRGIPIE